MKSISLAFNRLFLIAAKFNRMLPNLWLGDITLNDTASATELTKAQDDLYFEGASLIFSSFHTFCKENENPFPIYHKIIAAMRSNSKFQAVGDAILYRIYTNSFRNRGSISCFRLIKGLQVNTSLPSGSEIRGKVRIYFTFYRQGFLVISYVFATHSYVKEEEQEEAQSYGLVASSPFTGKDLLYVIADPSVMPQGNYLTYVNPVSGKAVQGTFNEFEKLLHDLLEVEGIEIFEPLQQHSRAVYCWKIQGSEKIEDIAKLVESHPYSIWFILATPVEKEKKKPRKKMLEEIQKGFVFTSRDFGFNISGGVLLVLRNKEKLPHNYDKTITNPLITLYQLLQAQRYALRFFDNDLKKIVESIQTVNFSDVTREVFENTIDRIANLKRQIMAFGNEMFWIESEIKSAHSARTLRRYHEAYAMKEDLDNLLRRLEGLDSFVQSIVLKIENKREKSIQRSLNLLSILFGIFALADVASNFLIWYLGSLASGNPIPLQFLAAGTVIVLLMVLVFFLLSVRFARRK
jgi:hypothetical protein